MTAHVARFADGSGLLFDEELQLMAPLSDALAAPSCACIPAAAADAAPDTTPAWRLRCRPAAIARRLAPLHRASPPPGQQALTLDITAIPGGITVAGPTAAATCARDDELLPLVKTVLLQELLRQPAVALHAAALSRDGRCLLLAGAPGAGKSTLCAALLHAGYGYVADDVLLLRQARVHGLALPLATKPGAWPVLEPRYPRLHRGPIHRRPDGVPVKYLTPSRLPAPSQAGWIVFPRYVPAASLRLDTVDQATAYGRLIAEAHAPDHRLAAEDFHALAGWMRQAACRDLSYGQLDEAVAALDALTARDVQAGVNSIATPFMQ